MGKSTYARCGIIVNVTPFEPEWEGFVTLEISNTTPLPAKIYANEGLCQILFFHGDQPCEVSYADRKGKYQKQQESSSPSSKRELFRIAKILSEIADTIYCVRHLSFQHAAHLKT